MKKPTPETDKFFATFADGEAAPSHAEYYARLQDLERERDHYKRTLEKIASASGFDNINGWARNVAKDALHSLHNSSVSYPTKEG